MSDQPLTEHIKTFLTQHYSPAVNPKTTLYMTTNELFFAAQQLYPSDSYSPANIAEWMHESGFKYTDVGQMRLMWMLEPS